MWKSYFYGAFVLNCRVDLHAIDATPARWRGDAGSSPLDGASEHPTHWLISTQAGTCRTTLRFEKAVPVMPDNVGYNKIVTGT